MKLEIPRWDVNPEFIDAFALVSILKIPNTKLVINTKMYNMSWINWALYLGEVDMTEGGRLFDSSEEFEEFLSDEFGIDFSADKEKDSFNSVEFTEEIELKNIHETQDANEITALKFYPYYKKLFILEVQGHRFPFRYDNDMQTYRPFLADYEEYDFMSFPENAINALVKKLKSIEKPNVLINNLKKNYTGKLNKSKMFKQTYKCSPTNAVEVIKKYRRDIKDFLNRYKNVKVVYTNNPTKEQLSKVLIECDDIFNKNLKWSEHFGGRHIPNAQATYFSDKDIKSTLVTVEVGDELAGVLVFVERQDYISVSVKCDYYSAFSGIGNFTLVECLKQGITNNKVVDFLSGEETFGYKDKVCDIVEEVYEI